MSKVKVIIQGNYGFFDLSDELEQLISDCGYESLWSIEARTDPRLVQYVERHPHGIVHGKEDYQYIRVVEVNTSIPWYIEKYDGRESIQYLRYTMIDKDLNYVKLS